MKNPIKQMGLMLAAALFMAVGMNCAGSSQQQPTTTGRQATTPASVQPSAPAPAPVVAPAAQTAAAAKTSTVDELDVAIRDASDCLNDNIPKGSKIVILNIESSSANLAEYIIDELIANAINDKNFSVVDRRQLEAIQTEQKFQMSGAVADKDALRIGQFFGAQTIVSGAMREMGGRYRMTIRALAVETAVVQSQCNQNVAIASSATLTDLVNSGGGRSTSGATAVTATTSGSTTQAAPAAAARPATPAAPPIQGTMVPGESLAEKLAWLTRAADSHNTYIVVVNANESIAPHTFEYKGAINITVVLRGDGTNRIIRLRSNDTMFTVKSNVTLILDNNITLQGHNGNNGPLISVDGGILRMNTGSAIVGNTRNTIDYTNGGGVFVTNSGTFTMAGGTISDNTAFNGGGVFVTRGTFTISGGTITGNTARQDGGGVFVSENGTFIMNDGTITSNTTSYGGGVYVRYSGATFTMSGGTISSNTATPGGGGGVFIYEYGTFTMRGGTITGNTAREVGGGVYVQFSLGATFTKTGGTITGYNSEPSNGNVVRDDNGVLARKGHATFVNEDRRKETTAGPGVNLSSSTAGGWDK